VTRELSKKRISHKAELARFGKDRFPHTKADPDFDSVRDHPRFKGMMAAAEARLATERESSGIAVSPL